MQNLLFILRASGIGLLLILFQSSARASLLESDRWALTGTLEGRIGYDSNLTTSHDGEGDGYVLTKPYLTLLRRNSSTDFRVNLGAANTLFFNRRQETQTDVQCDSIVAYTNPDTLIPVYKVQAIYIKSTQPNPYLGRRVERRHWMAAAEGYVPLTGKLGVRGAAEIETDDFDDEKLNRNDRMEAFAGIGYQRSPHSQILLNLGVARGRSRPHDALRLESNVRSREYSSTVRLVGELTPKITGSIYGGLGWVSYSGGYGNKDYFPVAGADMTWGLDPRRTLVLAAYSGVRYAPDGMAVEGQRLFVSFTHVIINRWQYVVRAGPTRSRYYRKSNERVDNAWDGGVEFIYIPSDRFRVALSFNTTTQDSDIGAYEFRRHVASLAASYRF